MGDNRLEREYPMGNPVSPFCRHCDTLRIEHRGALLCRTCDGGAHLIAPNH